MLERAQLWLSMLQGSEGAPSDQQVQALVILARLVQVSAIAGSGCSLVLARTRSRYALLAVPPSIASFLAARFFVMHPRETTHTLIQRLRIPPPYMPGQPVGIDMPNTQYSALVASLQLILHSPAGKRVLEADAHATLKSLVEGHGIAQLVRMRSWNGNFAALMPALCNRNAGASDPRSVLSHPAVIFDLLFTGDKGLRLLREGQEIFRSVIHVSVDSELDPNSLETLLLEYFHPSETDLAPCQLFTAPDEMFVRVSRPLPALQIFDAESLQAFRREVPDQIALPASVFVNGQAATYEPDMGVVHSVFLEGRPHYAVMKVGDFWWLCLGSQVSIISPQEAKRHLSEAHILHLRRVDTPHAGSAVGEN